MELNGTRKGGKMITWMEAERTKRYERFRREKSDNENRIFLNSLQALI